MTPGEILSHPWRIDVRALPPLLQDASICLGGSWWWFFYTRTHSGCDLYYCLYSLLLKDHLREPSCVQDVSQEYGSLCWPCISLSWQIAHGALRTGYCLVISFGMAYIPIACLRVVPLWSRPLTTSNLLSLYFPSCSPHGSMLGPYSIFKESSCAFWV